MWRTPLGGECGGIARSDAPTESPEDHAMYEFEAHRLRHAELRRAAALERLAREAVGARRAARREESASFGATGAEPHTGRPRRHRLPRTA